MAGFENAIRISMHEAMNRSILPKPEEPDIVAMLVLEGVPYIARTLQAITSRYGVHTTVSSVFCHQKPTVKFNHGSDSCELGDILIVHCHTKKGRASIHCNSLLLQAKINSRHIYNIPSKEQHQLRLYETWPEFEYVCSGPKLKGKKRDVNPKSRHSGAQYLMIDDAGLSSSASGMLGFPGTHCMAVSPAMRTLQSHFSLSNELYRFFFGVTGRSFSFQDSTDGSGWSTVILDLLEHSINHVFNRKNVNIKSEGRLGGDVTKSSVTGSNFCFMDPDFSYGMKAAGSHQQIISHFRELLRSSDRLPPINGESSGNDFDEMGGVSIILVETNEAED